MSDSKSGSKTDLNESNMPLLEAEEKAAEEKTDIPEKTMEVMELEEKKDEATEKKKETKADKTKKKKEKQEKVKKEKGPGCVETLSSGLDLTARDARGINQDINLDFDSVLAEPAATHGLDPVWRLNYVLFTQTKLWIYRILAAIISVPLAILWGAVFSLLTLLYVWLVSPLLRLLELVFSIFKKFWSSLLDATLSPVCRSLGHVLGRGTSSGLVQSA